MSTEKEFNYTIEVTLMQEIIRVIVTARNLAEAIGKAYLEVAFNNGKSPKMAKITRIWKD